MGYKHALVEAIKAKRQEYKAAGFEYFKNRKLLDNSYSMEYQEGYDLLWNRYRTSEAEYKRTKAELECLELDLANWMSLQAKQGDLFD